MRNINKVDAPKPKYKSARARLFNLLKAIDYSTSFVDKHLVTVYDCSGNYMGTMSPDAWLETIKISIRSAKRC